MTLFNESLGLAFAAALANVLGGAIVTRQQWAVRSLRYFIALSSGFMLGTVFLEMAPESFTRSPSSAAWAILAGYLIVHTFEHAFASHLHFGEETHHEELVNPAVGISALVGMLVHTFLDGVAIGAGFQLRGNAGILIAVAVLLHKIPDGFTISSIFMSAGHSKSRALAAAGLLGLSTIAGFLALQLWGGADAGGYALPLSTGSMLYVAATDLMPEVNREKGVRMAFLVFAGTGLFLLLRTLGGW